MRGITGFTQRWAVFVVAVVVWQLVTAAAANVWFPTPLEIVRHGGPCGMPAFNESQLSDEELKQIVEYLKMLN